MAIIIKRAAKITACRGYSLRFAGPFFREFVVSCPVDATEVVAAARREGVLAGIPLSRYFKDETQKLLLVAVTEKHTREDFDKFCGVLRGF